jgi:hypothetical protein
MKGYHSEAPGQQPIGNTTTSAKHPTQMQDDKKNEKQSK